MNLEITGKLIQFLPGQSGQGKSGPWVKQEIILETSDQFPRKICVACWGDKAAVAKAFAIGDTLKAAINLESREFNGRWYTDVKAWKIEKAGNQADELPQRSQPMPESAYEQASAEDDLPF